MLTEEEQNRLDFNKKLLGFDKSEQERIAERQRYAVFVNKISAYSRRLNSEVTEDAECEIIDPSKAVFSVDKIQKRMKELGYLEDIECEIIEPKQLPDSTQQIK